MSVFPIRLDSLSFGLVFSTTLGTIPGTWETLETWFLMIRWVSNEDKVRIMNCINNWVGIWVKIQRGEVDWGKGESRGREWYVCEGGWQQDRREGWGWRVKGWRSCPHSGWLARLSHPLGTVLVPLRMKLSRWLGPPSWALLSYPDDS